MYQDYNVGEHKATKGLRFLNYIIDLFSVYICLFIIILLAIIIETLIKDYSEIEIWFDELSTLADRIITSILYCIGIFCIEFLTKGRSLGKLITGTKVVMIDGSEPTTRDYFIRSICRIIPFDQISFFGANGFHDKFSKTTVVNKKGYEASLLFNESIDEIGNN